MLTGALAIFRSAARRVRPGAFRSSSAEFQLCPPPAPILSCTRKTTACPLQTVSAIFLKGLLPFRVPELFSPVAGGTLQIWPTGFAPFVYCNAPTRAGSPLFYLGSQKNDEKVPAMGTTKR